MHMPSKRVQKEMASEEASIWYVPAIGNEPFAVLIKAPTPSLKALILGSDLDLMFGKEKNYLCTGAQIHDMPDTPIFFVGVQRELEEHVALHDLLKTKRFPIFLFNEMDICLAWTNAKLDETEALNAAVFIGNHNYLYTGPFTDEASHALDNFCCTVDKTLCTAHTNHIEISRVHPKLENWQIINISFVGTQEHQTIVLSNKDEGETLEQTVWASLESLFPLTIEKNPYILKGEKKRELTDVFAQYEYGAYLIEAKDLSVLHAGYGRDQDRKIIGIQKQTKKAIGQLVGASKALNSGKKIFNTRDEELTIDRTKPHHCIILITELMHCGDWSEVVTQLINAIKTTGNFFHLLDLPEFIGLLKDCSGKPELMDYNLMERCKLFVKKRTVHIRSRRASSKKTANND